MAELSFKNLKIEDEKVRREVIEDLPILASSFSVFDFRSLIYALGNYPDSRAILDTNYPGMTEKTIDSFPQILEIMGKSESYFSKVKDAFEDIKQNILNKKGVFNIVEEFFAFLDTLKGRPEFEEQIKEYDVWRKLFDKVPSSYVSQDIDMNEMMRLAFSQNPEDRKLFNSVVRESGKENVFAYIMMGKKEIRDEKLLIIDSITDGDIDSMEFIGSGVSGIVFRAGKKVVKLSVKLGQKEIPYHPRLLMPHFRKVYEDLSAIEVYNFAKVKSAQITDEKLLDIYKELEAAGIAWTDAKKENLVELLEDNNLPEYNLGENFNLYGFLEDDRYPTTNHTVLKKGDIVICDLNNLYAIDDPVAQLRIGMPDKIVVDYMDEQESKARKKGRNERDGR